MTENMFKISHYFLNSSNDTFFSNLITDLNFVWEIIPEISKYLTLILKNSQKIIAEVPEGVYISNKPVFISKSAIIEPGVYIDGPAYIGENVVIRHGAYIRENAILMSNSLLGHSSEVKNSLFLPGAHAPHFNYVGDSVLGANVNLGAGTKLSNLTVLSEKDRLTGKRPTIKLKVNSEEFDTELSKFGAILGDNTQTGCNSVLNPGCIIGPNSLVYANVSLRKGYYPPNTIIKLRQNIELVKRIIE